MPTDNRNPLPAPVDTRSPAERAKAEQRAREAGLEALTDLTSKPEARPFETAREDASRTTSQPGSSTSTAAGTVATRNGSEPSPIDLGDILADRGRTHGNFLDNGTVSQDIKGYLRGFHRADGTRPWENLTIEQRESLDMIAHKIGRIMGGDPDFREHWEDGAGYFILSARRCTK